MNRRVVPARPAALAWLLLAAAALLLAPLGLLLAPTAAVAQVYVPDSTAPLTVSFQTERMGGGRVLIWGDVRNPSGNAYERVVLLAEGLDASGRVVSRGRGYVSGVIAPGGSTPFELRFVASGSERRFRVQVEAFQQIVN
jgi:hypothetical protein